jgi:drug/metabolite transporter (DMT)-like permease
MPRFLPSLTAAVAFGAAFPIADSALHRIDAFHLTAIRYGLAAVAFLALLWAFEGRRALRVPNWRRGVELWALGTLGFAGFNLLAYAGLEDSTPQHAAVMVALMPVITLLGTWLLTRVPPRPAILGFAGLALAGAALVISGGDPATLVTGGVTGGDGLVLLGVTAFVAYALGSRRFADFSPLRYTALSALGGTVSIVVVTEALTLAGDERTPSLADVGAVWWQLLYMVVVAAVIAVLAFNEGIRRLGPADNALFGNLIPLVTFAIAVGQGVRPGAGELAGTALTITALAGANLAARGQLRLRPQSAACAATRSAKPAKSLA